MDFSSVIDSRQPYLGQVEFPGPRISEMASHVSEEKLSLDKKVKCAPNNSRISGLLRVSRT
jgi:hypothetical protein